MRPEAEGWVTALIGDGENFRLQRHRLVCSLQTVGRLVYIADATNALRL